jgi:hypothetical protein
MVNGGRDKVPVGRHAVATRRPLHPGRSARGYHCHADRRGPPRARRARRFGTVAVDDLGSFLAVNPGARHLTERLYAISRGSSSANLHTRAGAVQRAWLTAYLSVSAGDRGL